MVFMVIGWCVIHGDFLKFSINVKKIIGVVVSFTVKNALSSYFSRIPRSLVLRNCLKRKRLLLYIYLKVLPLPLLL